MKLVMTESKQFYFDKIIHARSGAGHYRSIALCLLIHHYLDIVEDIRHILTCSEEIRYAHSSIHSLMANEISMIHEPTRTPGGIMLLRSIWIGYHVIGDLIHSPTQRLVPATITANIIFIGYFESAGLRSKTIRSSTESPFLSFRLTLPILGGILDALKAGFDHGDDHLRFGRGNLLDYFQFITTFDHFIAYPSRLSSAVAGVAHPPATPARPLVAARLDFPTACGQTVSRCDGSPYDGVRILNDAPPRPGVIRQPIPLAAAKANLRPAETREGVSFP